MPYIDQAGRRYLNDWQASHGEVVIQTAGELNYVLTQAARAFLETHERNYETMNTIIGAFDSAKMEFYRRVMLPYENAKRELNGDVY